MPIFSPQLEQHLRISCRCYICPTKWILYYKWWVVCVEKLLVSCSIKCENLWRGTCMQYPSVKQPIAVMCDRCDQHAVEHAKRSPLLSSRFDSFDRSTFFNHGPWYHIIGMNKLACHHMFCDNTSTISQSRVEDFFY